MTLLATRQSYIFGGSGDTNRSDIFYPVQRTIYSVPHEPYGPYIRQRLSSCKVKDRAPYPVLQSARVCRRWVEA